MFSERLRLCQGFANLLFVRICPIWLGRVGLGYGGPRAVAECGPVGGFGEGVLQVGWSRVPICVDLKRNP